MKHTTPRMSAHRDEYGDITAYARDDTDPAVMMALHRARQRGDRIRLWYGDTDTGEAWPEEHDVIGYVGRSTGREPVFILVHNSRSTGGPAILTSSVVRIDLTSDGHTLYQHPHFTPGKWTYHCDASEEPFYWNVYHNGELHVRFEKAVDARHYVRFMKGERYKK